MDYAASAAQSWKELLNVGEPDVIEMGMLLERIASEQEALQVRALRPFRERGITVPSDFRHLALLFRAARPPTGLTMVQQAELLGSAPAATSKRLGRFESLGLAARREIESDRRSYAWTLTNSGRTLVTDAFVVMYASHHQLVEDFDKAERVELAASLRRLIENAR